MKLFSKILWVLIAVVVFGLALKNMQDIVLHFFLGYELKGPVALVLFGIFFAGGVMGVLAMTPTFFRQRRDLTKYRKTIVSMQKETEAQQQARVQQPQPDSIVNQ